MAIRCPHQTASMKPPVGAASAAKRDAIARSIAAKAAPTTQSARVVVDTVGAASAAINASHPSIVSTCANPSCAREQSGKRKTLTNVPTAPVQFYGRATLFDMANAKIGGQLDGLERVALHRHGLFRILGKQAGVALRPVAGANTAASEELAC